LSIRFDLTASVQARRALGLLLLALLVVGLTPAASNALTLPANFTDQTVVTGIDRPTSIAFTPDGRMLIGAEAGIVRVYEAGSLVTQPALDISSRVCSDQERGLMSVAVDPAFKTNHFIYVYYTYKKLGACQYGSNGDTLLPVNRVSRFVLGNDDVADPASEKVLIDNIPAPEGYHIGADLEFGKDGYLYASTGDGGCQYSDPVWCDRYNAASRDQNVLLGKVLRITRDGAIPPTNPYQGTDSATCAATGVTAAGKKCQETFAWGLRNPFRMAFDPNATGTRFFVNDVGEITWEEIDLGKAGADYGWNVREGHCATGSTTDCGPPPSGMTNPIYDYNHDTGCMSVTGGAFVPDGIWPVQYDRTYLFGDLVCGRMFVLTQQPDGSFSRTDFAQGFGAYGLVDMVFGPSGADWALYYINWNAPGQEIHRISYTGPPRGYARPRGASPFRVPLVPAFNACTTPNRNHGAPLASGSCTPPAQSSSQLTVGTPDANGKPVGSSGFVLVRAIAGDPATTADEADVALHLVVSDVRKRSDLSDYSGELQLTAGLRITDKDNGGSSPAATVADTPYAAALPCQPTSLTTIGSTCSLSTTADALAPGSIKEGRRTIWELGQVQVYDGGADGIASTAPNTVFLRQGIFTP
jgi:glucose/arabinose dehydrogenase